MKQLIWLSLFLVLGATVLGVSSQNQFKTSSLLKVAKYPLDNSPQILTINFSDSLFVAFDTVKCGLYKIWKGGFAATDSSVISNGTTFYENYLLNSDFKLLDTNGMGYSPTVKFKGFSIDNNQINLKYSINDENKTIEIEELVSCETNDQPTLTYKFNCDELESDEVGIFISNYSLRKPITITAHNGIVASGIDKLLLLKKDGSTFILQFE